MHNRYVIAIANTYTRWLWRALVERLAVELDAMPLLLVGTPQDKRFYERQFDTETAIEIEVLRDPYVTVLDGEPHDDLGELNQRATHLEQRFGMTLAREFVLADRHIGRGYFTLGSGHPRSQVSAAMTGAGTLAACVSQFEYTQELLDRYQPVLVVSYYGGGGLRGKPFSLLCRERGIPFRALCPARFDDLMYWAEDEFEGNSSLVSQLSVPAPTLTDSEVEATVADLKPSALSTNPAAVRRVKRVTNIAVISYCVARVAVQRLYGRLRGYHFAQTGYTVRSNAAFMWRQRAHWRELDRLATLDLESLRGRKLVYFTLQQEPEASTLVLSPEHVNQEATLVELSLSLPADAVLVVKEHLWQVGRRPDGFYRRLTEVPNVVLVHPEASSLALIGMATLVCTITSSAGYEAAVLGRRTVFFWKRAPLAVIPHVYSLAYADMQAAAPKLLEPISVEEQARQRNDGAVLLQRLRAFCMDLASLNVHGRQHAPSEDELELLVRPLINSLHSDTFKQPGSEH